MRNRPFFPAHFAATVFLLSATLLAAKLAAVRKPEPLVHPLSTISQNLAGFTGWDNNALDPHTLDTLRATSYLSRTYSRPDLTADLFIAFYAMQRAGESMHSPKNCLPGAGWEIWNYGRADVPVGNDRVEINQYNISREGERRIVLYWYQSKSRIIASEYLGKVLLARDTLLERGTSAAIARIVLPDRPVAVEQGKAMVAALIPQLRHCFE